MRHRFPVLVATVLLPLAARTVAAAPIVPDGFEIEQMAGEGTLSFVTGLAFDAQGVLHASEANLFTGSGRVLRLADGDGDGTLETVTVFAEGFGIVTGIAFRGPVPRGRGREGGDAPPMTHLERIRLGHFRGRTLDLVVSHFVPGVAGSGTISVVRDRNGDGAAETCHDIVTGLPSDGLNGNQQPAIGPDGRIYFGQGARTNAGGPADAPENGTILRVEDDGDGLAIHAAGLRNAFDLAFTAQGDLFATENGPDPSGPGPVAGTPDELNSIVSGDHYGWPAHFGMPPEGSGTIGPLVELSPSTSTNGLAVSTSPSFCGFEEDLFAAQFGSFSDPSIGRRIVRFDRRGPHAMRVDVFATGFERPLDVVVGPDGNLWVADFSSVFFTPGSASIWRIAPVDADGDGTLDICNG